MSDDEAAPGAATPGDGVKQPVRFERTSSGLEFDRLAYFSDAVFAIAMTLLVVGIGIPHVADAKLVDHLRGLRPEIMSFFISFVVIGNYWLAHHRFFANLKAVSPRLMVLNLVYLAAIAFTPFPTELAGKYTDQAISIVIYAITLGIASSLESIMFVTAHREHLFRVELQKDVVRYSVLASLIPVLVFVLSIPIAFFDTGVALLSWLLIFPLEGVLARRMKPADAGELI